ncbi:hypothetical protein HJG60_012155 [Phyllostomus discolor]|uniref:Meprin A subunit beta-like n=1 Tax=Phyllostomus discolor TaxID=89673 RepID=A0A833Z7V7_9CHIR|nr:hypothetical protein HJG60_012155 [Phyllostomus discolor]
MVDYIFIWTRVLFIYCCFLTVHCVQPNCTSVADFDNCLGNTTDFCPKDIVCACKDGEPFCKCPNFRGQWGNYWYMGAKCDQLWSTLDLVLVTVLPGIGLALIVGVTIQTIHYCKKKSKNNINDQRQQNSSSGLQPEHKFAYAFDNAARFSQPHEGQNPWSLTRQNGLPSSPVSPQQQFSGRDYNFMIHKEDNPNIYPSYNLNGPPGMAKPEANYANKYSSSMYMKPLSNFSTPGLPKSNYIPREKQQIGYPSSEEQEIPYRIGRVQIKSGY